MKKTTRATLKAFIRNNLDRLHIRVDACFNGMTDCREATGATGFSKALPTDCHVANTLGVEGAWFVGGSRDYFRTYEDENFTGYSVINCCGGFVLAVPK